MSNAHDELVQGRTDRSLVHNTGHSEAGKPTADQLHEDLEAMLANATEESFDEDKLKRLLNDLDEVEPLPADSDAFSPDAGLVRLHMRMAAEDEDKASSPADTSFISSKNSHPKRRFSKLTIIAAVFVMLFATMSVAQGFSWNLFDRIALWTREVFHYEDEQTAVEGAQILRNPLEGGEERYYDSIEELVEDFGISAPLFPTWVPERMGEPTIHAVSSDIGICLYVEYVTAYGNLLIRFNQIDLRESRDIEKNESGADAVVQNGQCYYLISDVSCEKAIWQNGTFDCQLWGTVSQDEMKQIITSIE